MSSQRLRVQASRQSSSFYLSIPNFCMSYEETSSPRVFLSKLLSCHIIWLKILSCFSLCITNNRGKLLFMSMLSLGLQLALLHTNTDYFLSNFQSFHLLPSPYSSSPCCISASSKLAQTSKGCFVSLNLLARAGSSLASSFICFTILDASLARRPLTAI